MNEQTLKLLEQFAEKIGTTADKIWTVLINQAYINSWINLFFLLFFIISGFGLYKLHEKFKKDEEDYLFYDEGKTAIIIIFLIIWFFGTIFTIFSIKSMIIGFTNPDYYALDKIMYIIK